MVARPGYGSFGRQIHVYANVFRLEYKATVVHQYDVDIQPVAPPQSMPSVPSTVSQTFIQEVEAEEGMDVVVAVVAVAATSHKDQ